MLAKQMLRLTVAVTLATVAVVSFATKANSQIQVQSCPSTSAQTFPFSGSATACTPTANSACNQAFRALKAMMVASAGVVCGPCPVPQSCPKSATNLSGPVAFTIPVFDPVMNCWRCSTAFTGTFRIRCRACQ